MDVLPVIHDPYAGEIDQLYDMDTGTFYWLLLGKDTKQLDFIFNRYHHSRKYRDLFHKLGTAL